MKAVATPIMAPTIPEIRAGDNRWVPMVGKGSGRTAGEAEFGLRNRRRQTKLRLPVTQNVQGGGGGPAAR